VLPLVPDTAHTPVPEDGSTVKTTGLPEPPPVADRVADPPTVPAAGAVKPAAPTARRPRSRKAGGRPVTRKLTPAELQDLPAVTSLVTAGQALRVGRTKAYELARAGEFPCPVIRAGKTYLVPTAGLLALLGLPVPGRPDGLAMKEH
jgi:hypothetical protein